MQCAKDGVLISHVVKALKDIGALRPADGDNLARRSCVPNYGGRELPLTFCRSAGRTLFLAVIHDELHNPRREFRSKL
jgi:hypothetical protein